MKGFTSQEKLNDQYYATFLPVGSGKVAIDMAPKALFPISLTAETPVSSRLARGTDGNKSKQLIEITAHGMREGDVLRFITGPLINTESVVVGVIDANTLVLGNIIADATTSTCLKMRHVTLTLDENGSLVTTSGPIQYILDSVAEQVEEDTVTPANNRALPTRSFVNVDGVQEEVKIDTATPANTQPMPSGLFFMRDGIATPVAKDTVTPGNTRPIPMELVSTTGVEATFNVTTGDLNIQTTHTGLSPDSMQIGNGTNLMAVNASLQAEVHDTDANAALVTLNAVDFATQTTLAALLTELDLKADLTETQPVSIAAAFPIPTGASTEAKQDAEIVILTSLNGKDFATAAKQDTAQTRLDLLATEAKQDTIIANQGTAQTRLDLLATEAKQDTLQLKVDTLATEAKQDDMIVELTAIKTAVEASIDTVEDYYKRDFTGSPLTTASSWVTLRALAAAIKKISITNNSGNELLIRNQATNKSIIVGQGAVFAASLIGAIADVIEILALGADAVDGIIYINFEG